jgi:hypothetical protein
MESSSGAIVLAAAAALLSQGIAADIIDLKNTSALPEGVGLAQTFPGDRGIEDDPRVIFADNFESGDFSRWDEHTEAAGILSLVDESRFAASLGKHSLRVTATLGENTGGGLTKWFESSERVFVRFYVKFAPDCDYTHHLVRLRANKGLQGADKWSGFGKAGLKPDGNDRFSTGIEPWGANGTIAPPGAWNFYTYWQDMKCSGDGKFWGNSFMPPDSPPIPRGEWICVEFMLKHNHPTENDGEQAFWIDGKPCGHWGGFRWRSSPSLWANSLSLESYITDRWTKHPINRVFFDNVVVARDYIGPAQ